MTKQEHIAALSLAEQYFFEKNHTLAEVLLNKILISEGGHARANELLAYILDARGEKALAIMHLTRVCENAAASFEALYSLGSYLLTRQEYEEAAKYINLSLKKGGNFFEGLHDLGLAYIGLKKFNEASHCLQGAVNLNPLSFEALNNLGAVLRNLGEFSESLKYLDAAIKIDPGQSGVWLNKGVTFDTMGQFEDALQCYDQALKINSEYLEGICNKANTLQCMGRYSQADSLYRRALEIAPNDADSHYNHSYLCLLSGEFSLGWRKYEARWSSIDAPPYIFRNIPRLDSLKSLASKSLLVWAEQGLGDTIQFCRYISLLGNLGAKVTLLVQPALFSLLKDLDGIATITDSQPESIAEFDFQIPLMSLPLLFDTDLSNIPAKTPYIFADPLKASVWRERLGQKDRLRVGLVWSGGFRKDLPALWGVNRRRNIPFKKIASLQELDTVNFYNLQKGEPAESEFLIEAPKFWSKKNLISFVGELKDFSDTAALIENLDLVITVDTSTAHLAAAMGKPVWILNRFDTCWRWLLDRQDSPWYPTVTLYSQQNPGDWDEVIARVKVDLQALSQSAGGGDSRIYDN